MVATRLPVQFSAVAAARCLSRREHRAIVALEEHDLHRRSPGRTRILGEIAGLILQMAQRNPSRPRTRTQDALANVDSTEPDVDNELLIAATANDSTVAAAIHCAAPLGEALNCCYCEAA